MYNLHSRIVQFMFSYCADVHGFLLVEIFGVSSGISYFEMHPTVIKYTILRTSNISIQSALSQTVINIA